MLRGLQPFPVWNHIGHLVYCFEAYNLSLSGTTSAITSIASRLTTFPCLEPHRSSRLLLRGLQPFPVWNHIGHLVYCFEAYNLSLSGTTSAISSIASRLTTFPCLEPHRPSRLLLRGLQPFPVWNHIGHHVYCFEAYNLSLSGTTSVISSIASRLTTFPCLEPHRSSRLLLRGLQPFPVWNHIGHLVYCFEAYNLSLSGTTSAISSIASRLTTFPCLEPHRSSRLLLRGLQPFPVWNHVGHHVYCFEAYNLSSVWNHIGHLVYCFEAYNLSLSGTTSAISSIASRLTTFPCLEPRRPSRLLLRGLQPFPVWNHVGRLVYCFEAYNLSLSGTTSAISSIASRLTTFPCLEPHRPSRLLLRGLQPFPVWNHIGHHVYCFEAYNLSLSGTTSVISSIASRLTTFPCLEPHRSSRLLLRGLQPFPVWNHIGHLVYCFEAYNLSLSGTTSAISSIASRLTTFPCLEPHRSSRLLLRGLQPFPVWNHVGHHVYCFEAYNLSSVWNHIGHLVYCFEAYNLSLSGTTSAISSIASRLITFPCLEPRRPSRLLLRGLQPFPVWNHVGRLVYCFEAYNLSLSGTTSAISSIASRLTTFPCLKKYSPLLKYAA